MKPFNLAEALAGKRVVTRDGRKVLKIVDMGCQTFPIVAVLEGEEEWPILFNKDGSWDRPGMNANSKYDLFMASEKREYWVNVYKNASGYTFLGDTYSNEQEAVNADTNTRSNSIKYIKTIKIHEEEI